MWFLVQGIIAQVTPAETPWEKWVFTYGPLTVMFALFVISLVKYSPKIVASHLSLIDQLKTSNIDQQRWSREQQEFNAKISEITARIADAVIETPQMHARTQGALKHLLSALHLVYDHPEARNLLKRAIERLEDED